MITSQARNRVVIVKRLLREWEKEITELRKLSLSSKNTLLINRLNRLIHIQTKALHAILILINRLYRSDDIDKKPH